MLIDTILFYVFALLVLGGGVLTITRRSAVHSAISLIVSLLGVAGLYLLQQYLRRTGDPALAILKARVGP